jgi:hypothetical protein
MFNKRTKLSLLALSCSVLASRAIASSGVPSDIIGDVAKDCARQAASKTKGQIALTYKPTSSSVSSNNFALAQSPAAQAPATQTPAAQDPNANGRWWPHPINSPPFPLPDWISESQQPIGEDWDAGDGPLQKSLLGTQWDKARIRTYGWFDFGYTESTSKHNNYPLSYDVIPNAPVLDQAVLRIERMPDTVQTDHKDWGFRITQIYGIDYRFLAGDGYVFDQLQKHNDKYGYDFPEVYGQIYLPKAAPLGGVVQVGRYISPADIECQLAPQNYLYSHSLMYTVDPYTYTGANIQQTWSKTWSTMFGIDAGNDKSWWEKSAEVNFEALVGWHSPNNKDDVWVGPDQIGNGHYSWGHDSEQIFSATWGHKFNDRWHMQNEMYYMWSYDAEKGGTETDGPPQTFASGGGPGPIIPGQSHANGYTTYLMYQTDKWSYWCFRTDWLGDPEGWRTGVSNNYYSLTLGYDHWFSPTTTFRPELRYEWADKNDAYDNGTRKTQMELAADIIFHF